MGGYAKKKHYDTIVIGAGALGMAAGYFLAKRGASVLLVDAYDPPHTNGSHHGDTRIIRHAYTMAAPYVPLALRAQALWTELAKATGCSLFTQTGVLRVGPADTAYIRDQAAVGERFAIPVETLSAGEIARRWPGILVADSMQGNLEPNAGVLAAESCLLAYRLHAEANGAHLLTDTPVRHVRFGQAYATVETAAGAFTADRLVVTAGAWTGRLLDELRLPLRVMRRTVGWFDADPKLYGAAEASCPAFIWSDAAGDYYGFPGFDGSGLKVGRHDGDRPIDPDGPVAPFGEEDETELRRFLGVYFPQAAEGKLLRSAVCKYTMTPDEHFIVDSHPAHPHVWIGTACSGHGFKFASALGEMLAQLASGETAALDRSIFALGREGLRPQNFESDWS